MLIRSFDELSSKTAEVGSEAEKRAFEKEGVYDISAAQAIYRSMAMPAPLVPDFFVGLRRRFGKCGPVSGCPVGPMKTSPVPV